MTLCRALAVLCLCGLWSFGCASTKSAIPMDGAEGATYTPPEARSTAETPDTNPVKPAVATAGRSGDVRPASATARSAFQRGVEAAHKGELARAEAELKKALSDNDTLDYAWTNLGLVYERQGKLAEAEQAYERALVTRPSQDVAWEYLTRLYCRSGRAAAMEGRLRAAIQSQPASLGLRNALVVALVKQGKHTPGASEAKKVLKADERNVRAMQLLAQIYFQEGKLELSKMVLENARAISPNEAVTHNQLGLVQLALKSRPSALESFKQAVTLQPDYVEAQNNFGALLNETQDYDSAVSALELAVKNAPDFAQARLNLGNAYRGKQDFSRAIGEYEAVLKLRPELKDTYFNLAILHLDSELPSMDPVARYQKALAYFDTYKKHGGRDDRVEQYVKDAHKGMEKEQRKKERAERDRLKKAAAPTSTSTPPSRAPPAPAPKQGTHGTAPAAPSSSKVGTP